MNVLSLEKQTRVIAALTEGVSVRATERLTDVHRETILKLSVDVGRGCRRLLDGLMRDLSCAVLELDEQWSFVGCKQRNASEEDKATGQRGDSWLFIALDATSKAVVSWTVGKRTGERTMAFVNDLHARLLTRPQVTADGFSAYTEAVVSAFGEEVDFAQLTKLFWIPQGNTAAVRYSPGSIRGIEKNVVCGRPDEDKISTSYVERFNLETRMHLRRFTRLTNGFSKKVANHEAAIALHVAAYNLCRINSAIRCTPAMALGVTDHVWTISELIQAALGAQQASPVYTPPQGPLPGMSAAKAKLAGGRRPSLQVIQGGKGRRK